MIKEKTTQYKRYNNQNSNRRGHTSVIPNPLALQTMANIKNFGKVLVKVVLYSCTADSSLVADFHYSQIWQGLARVEVLS